LDPLCVYSADVAYETQINAAVLFDCANEVKISAAEAEGGLAGCADGCN
jgi:hypothetical protein